MNDVYNDIKLRTGGDIYLGVVGPVRTGKSTFIKNFMEKFVMPNIENDYKFLRTKDELPQSAAGKTIMTTEPKFVPNESVEIVLDDNIKMKTKLVDCVGYLVDDAIGHMEDDQPRMVKTPWKDEEMPFEEAAEMGTQKVINEHATIGLVVTTDGTIADIPRKSYEKAEARVVSELKELKKPFVILLNSAESESDNTLRLAKELEEKYDAPVLATDVSELREEDVKNIFEKVLDEFPVTEIGFKLPEWFDTLDVDYWLKQDVITIIKEMFNKDYSLREVKKMIEELKLNKELIADAIVTSAKAEDGSVEISIELDKTVFFKVLKEMSKEEVNTEGDLFKLITKLCNIKYEYDKISMALEEVKVKGYGIVTPQMEELKLEEPEIVKSGSKFGVKLKASAPSIHMIMANIETEVSPIVGSEKQSEDLVKYLLSEFETDPKKIWESNIFGKSLHELVNEGLHNKLYKMPDEAQMKLQETLQRIINEGSGGLICIIL